MPEEMNQTEVKKPSKIKSIFKFAFDVPSWLGLKTLTEGGSWISSLFKDIFKVPSMDAHDTFEQAMVRAQISEEDLAKQAKAFFRNSFIFLGLAVLDLIYTAYLWSNSYFLVYLGAFLVFCMLLIQAYFYSFWCFQIQQRKLGCTFKAWLNWLIRGRA